MCDARLLLRGRKSIPCYVPVNSISYYSPTMRRWLSCFLSRARPGASPFYGLAQNRVYIYKHGGQICNLPFIARGGRARLWLFKRFH